MHDEYTMRRSAGSAIDASPIRRLDCAGFQVDENRATRKPVMFPSTTLRKRSSIAIEKLVFALAESQTRGLSSYETGFVPSTSAA